MYDWIYNMKILSSHVIFEPYINLIYKCLMPYLNVYGVYMFDMNYDIDEYVWLNVTFIHHDYMLSEDEHLSCMLCIKQERMELKVWSFGPETHAGKGRIYSFGAQTYASKGRWPPKDQIIEMILRSPDVRWQRKVIPRLAQSFAKGRWRPFSPSPVREFLR